MIPLCEPEFGPEEEDLVLQVIRSGWLSEGPMVEQFEGECAGLHGKRFAIMTPSGSAALYLALRACYDSSPVALRNPFQVLLPAYTFIAPINAALLANTVVRLIDIDYDTLCMDPELIPRSYVKRVIVPVHFNGNVCKVPAVGEKDVVVEDAACAFGVEGIGFGDFTCLSFSIPKIITTGYGGMVLTDDAHLADRVRCLKDHGKLIHKDVDHAAFGFNFRVSELAAAVGLGQLSGLYRFRSSRAAVIGCYLQEGVPVLKSPTPWYAFVKVTNRDECIRHLRGAGYDARWLYKAVHHNSGYEWLGQPGDFPNAERAEETLVALPISAKLPLDTVGLISEALKEVADFIPCITPKVDNMVV